MITIQDCIALSQLTEDEIEAIAEHEHVPDMLAVEIGAFYVESEHGEKHIAAIIRDDIEQARRTGHIAHAAKLQLVLRHYLEGHPRAN